MKFLTDENLAKETVRALRGVGFQVKDVKEENLQGSSDHFLVRLANREQLVIVTFDADFAHLFEDGIIKTGVVLIVHKREKSQQITERLLKFLRNKNEKDLLNKLSVVI